MARGYTGKILFVDLSSGKITNEELDEKLCRNYLGGYGIGAALLYNRQKAGVNALGPENTLGLMTGPLTGTTAMSATRYTAVAKSPLTGGWGDANSGGDFGTVLKQGGYDGVFFSGIAEKPVYLLIDNVKAELKDAGHLWGKDSFETEDILKGEHGDKTAVSCIGQSGEKLCLISGIITKKGAAAGRSGLGAVMGSKKLKAVAVKGSQAIPVADKESLARLRREHIADLRKPNPSGKSELESKNKYGTAADVAGAAHSGDTPVKNWGGIGVIDLPDVSDFAPDNIIANLTKRESCWQCPVACQALLKEGAGEYKYPAGARRPEYETLASFGALCLNNNLESIIMVNDICNRYGLDTISTGCTIAFAMECYEKGLITNKDTDGIELTWGNHRSIVAMTEKMARREGFGDVLADGVKIAADRIGKGADLYAIHIGGQELGMHDPKLPPPPFAPNQPPVARFSMDATPGRHTQDFGPSGFQNHVVNSVGLCMFSFSGEFEASKYLVGYMKAATGWDFTWNELLKAGDRIGTIRHIFNLREGINELERKIPGRVIGKPPYTAGPLAGVTANAEAEIYWSLGALNWDRLTTKPSKEKLHELGLEELITDVYTE